MSTTPNMYTSERAGDAKDPTTDASSTPQATDGISGTLSAMVVSEDSTPTQPQPVEPQAINQPIPDERSPTLQPGHVTADGELSPSPPLDTSAELASSSQDPTTDASSTTQPTDSIPGTDVPTVLVSEPPHPAPDEPINPPAQDERLSVVQPGRVIADEELPPPLEGITPIDTTIKKKTRADGGKMADVYRTVWTKPDGSTMEVAVKVIRREGKIDEDRFSNRVKREMVIWMAAKHPNILAFLGYTLNERGIPCLVSPWCRNGNLAAYIERVRPGEVEKLRLLIGAAHGVVHLHSHNPPISHGDIKPDNVIILDNLEAALCDFGVSRGLASFGKHTLATTTGNKIGGSAAYQAKEILEGTGMSSPKGDVFAFGGLILATMSGLAPFHLKKKDPSKIICVVKGQKPSPADHPLLPANDPLWVIMRECWSMDPNLRPSMEVLIERLEAERTRRMIGGMNVG